MALASAFFLPVLLFTFLFRTNKSGITQKDTHTERKNKFKKKKEKKVGVFMAELSFLNQGGFQPKIDSLQLARLAIIDQKGENGKQQSHYTGRFACSPLKTEWLCRLVNAPFFVWSKNVVISNFYSPHFNIPQLYVGVKLPLRRWQWVYEGSQWPRSLLQRLHSSIFHVESLE